MDTPQQNTGYLIVNVSTARGAIPLEGATVTVYDSEAEGDPIVIRVSTDNSGKTDRLALPAPDRDLAMAPGRAKPYSTYMVEAIKDGYYTVTNNGVPIFSGITSIQPVQMIPLAEFNSESVYPRSGIEIDESENPQL